MTEQEILDRKTEITTSLVNQLIEKGESVTEEYADWVNRAYELRELGAAGLQLYHQLSQMDGFAYDSYQTSVNFRSALRNQRNNVDGNADDNHAKSRTLQSFFYLCRDRGLQVPQIEGVSVHARQSNSGYEMEAIDPEKADSIGSEQLLASLKGSTFKKWQQICQKAEKLIHQHITICDILEKNASQKQKEQKIDILDCTSVS